MSPVEQNCFVHSFDDVPGVVFHTIFRPQARDLIEHCRKLVGVDNVYILTSSLREYAHRLNIAGKFRFAEDHIFTREDLRKHEYATAYGGTAYVGNKDILDENNVLIDNLPPRQNEGKCAFIGIRGQSHYIEVPGYYGVNFPNDQFLPNIIEKLKELS